MSCSHVLGVMSDMETTHVDRDYTYRKCTVCEYKEALPRAGKIWTGYSLQAESKRDFERREFAKDLLQPKDKRGNINELFDHAYGDPYAKKVEMGRDIESYRIKDEQNKEGTK